METREFGERAEKEIRALLTVALRIDPVYLNKRDEELLDIHVERILKDTRTISSDRKIDRYVQARKKELEIDFQKSRTAVCLKTDMQSLSERCDTEPALSMQLEDLLRFNDEQMMRQDEQARSRYLKDAWRRLYIANQILSDHSELCAFIKEQEDHPESIRTIARKIRKKEYRIDRKYYSVDAVIRSDKIELKNFVIRKDRVNDRELSL